MGIINDNKAEILQRIKDRDKSKMLDVQEVLIKDEDLFGWDFTNINISLSQFDNCDLTGADFSNSIVQNTRFQDTPMHGVKFVNADVTGSIFRYINLSDADIRGANMHYSVLEYANLEGVIDDENTKFYRLHCPETGPFIAWKCCTELRVVQLLVPADALRVSATAETCRCNKAKVLSIKSIDETVSYDWAQSTVDPDFYYERGKWVEPANGFEPDRWRDSSRGIHFFMSREECIAYQTV